MGYRTRQAMAREPKPAPSAPLPAGRPPSPASGERDANGGALHWNPGTHCSERIFQGIRNLVWVISNRVPLPACGERVPKAGEGEGRSYRIVRLGDASNAAFPKGYRTRQAMARVRKQAPSAPLPACRPPSPRKRGEGRKRRRPVLESGYPFQWLPGGRAPAGLVSMTPTDDRQPLRSSRLHGRRYFVPCAQYLQIAAAMRVLAASQLRGSGFQPRALDPAVAVVGAASPPRVPDLVGARLLWP